jgi:hypothetical protein
LTPTTIDIGTSRKDGKKGMGKHRNRRQSERSNILGSTRDLARENQILHSKVRDLDPRVEGILSQIPEASESQKLELSLLLQKIARGPASLLERPEASELVNQLRETAHKRDKVAKRYEADQAAFIEDILDRTERNKMTGAQAEKAKADAVRILSEATSTARSRNAISKKNFERLLNSMPKRTIHVTGHIEMVQSGQNVEPVVAPEVIRIKHLAWILHPGAHEVPELVAQVFDQRQRGAAMAAARNRALQATGEAGRDTNVYERWKAINDEFGSPSELPQAYGII